MTPEYTKCEPAKGLSQQVIIYAKNWYGQSGDAIADLRAIMALYSGIKEQYISEMDVKGAIVFTFVNYVSNPYDLEEGILNALGWSHLSSLHKESGFRPEAFFLGKLSIIKGCYVDMNKKLTGISFRLAEIIDEKTS